jgi:hypothetical protein
MIQSKNIKYLNKDFSDFKENLLNYAKVYFPNTFNDFSQADPAMMFIEMVSYVGDVLSYYTDYQLKENLIQYAEEDKNVIALAQTLGYKYRPSTPSTTLLSVYQLVPAAGSNQTNVPDYNYALHINSGMIVSNEDSTMTFQTKYPVDFNYSSAYDPTTVNIYELDNNGDPTYYLLKKSVVIESTKTKTTTFDFTDPKKYDKVLIDDDNVVEILSVTDSDGNIWYETEYLAQDIIIDEIQNTINTGYGDYNSSVPYLLKVRKVPRRFISRYNKDNKLELLFGSGIEYAPSNVGNLVTEEFLPNLHYVGLGTTIGIKDIDKAWNPVNFLYSDAYGLVPTNTTLTVNYTVGGGLRTNSAPNSIKKISSYVLKENTTTVDSKLYDFIKTTIACNNPEQATGGKDKDTIEEIKLKATANFAAQDRAVTKTDYIFRTLSMPARYGSIAKAYITQDNDISNKKSNALNLYILSYDANKKIVNSNIAIKTNLKTYIDKYRMLTDSINIRDAFVINVAIYYDIIIYPEYNNNEVLLKCNNKLKDYFLIDNWQINQAIILSELRKEIYDIEGVKSITNISVENKFDSTQGYWPTVYNINYATRDGIIYPSKDPSIFEVRFPDNDIYGRVVNI